MNNTVTQTAIATRTIPDIPDPAATGWTKIGNDVIGVIPKIGLATFVVYVVIAKHANAAGVAWPSVRTIARLTGTTICTVRRAIRILQNEGLIRVERRKDAVGRDISSLYTISPGRESVTRAPPGYHQSTGEGITRAPRTRLIEQDPVNKTFSLSKTLLRRNGSGNAGMSK